MLCVKCSMIEWLRGQDGIMQNPVLCLAFWNAYICNTPDTFTVVCNKYSTSSCFDSLTKILENLLSYYYNSNLYNTAI